MEEKKIHNPEDHLNQQGEHPAHIKTRFGVSDADPETGEFLSDMEYDEGDKFYEEMGALIEGKDVEDQHTPDLTTDPENIA